MMPTQDVLDYVFLQRPDGLRPGDFTHAVMAVLRCSLEDAREFNGRMLTNGRVALNWHGELVVVR